MRLKGLYQKFYRRYNKLIHFIIHTSAALAVLFFLSRFFAIGKVNVKGAVELKGLEILENRLFFFVSEDKLEERLYEVNPDVASIEVKKTFPNQIEIIVEKTEAVAAFSVEQGYLFLSPDGRVVAKKRNLEPDLVVVNYYQTFNFSQFSVGDTVGYQDVKFALFFIKEADRLGFKIDNVDINSLDMIILKTDGKDYFLTTRKDRKKQMGELETVIERLRLEAVDYQSVDFRFDKPIIKLKQ